MRYFALTIDVVVTDDDVVLEELQNYVESLALGVNGAYGGSVTEVEGPTVELLPCCANCGALGATFVGWTNQPACLAHSWTYTTDTAAFGPV